MAILIMGKYVISKLSIVLYHKQIDLSIGFIKFLERYFFKSTLSDKKAKESRYLGVLIAL